MTSMSPIPPHSDQPGSAGRPGWAAQPGTTPGYPQTPMGPQPPQPPAGGKRSCVKALLTHGATALIALSLGAAAGGGNGGSGGTADTARPAPTVTVTRTVAAAPKSSGSGAHKPAKKAGPATSISSDGQYLVGHDIKAGTYRTAGPGDDSMGLGCYWARLSNASGELDAITANDNITGQASVTVRQGEYFETKGCKRWVKVG